MTAELIKEAEVKGIFTLDGLVIEPSEEPFATGLAKLFRSTGELAYQADVIEGAFEIDGVREGDYVLHIVPTGNETADVFHTYYEHVVF